MLLSVRDIYACHEAWSDTFSSLRPQELHAIISSPKTYKTGDEIELPSLSLDNGLKFLGWYDNPNLTGEAVNKVKTTDSGNKTYYAKWEEEVKVESIEINDISELLLFSTHQLVWTLNPSNATDSSVEFSSSNTSVATITANGLIKAIANGKTTITVSVNGNHELDRKFVLEVYTSDYIDGEYETTSYVVIDESIKLNALIFRRNDTTSNVEWVSETPEIATVDDNGNVTALNVGTAKIIAKDPNNETLKLEFLVVVLEELPEDVLSLALQSNESNIYTRYDLNIGGTYRKDILGSVSKLLGTTLNKKTSYYDQANASEATYGKMSSIEFITVHYTGNMASGANAAANASYFATNGSTSIHYTTGNDGVYYCMDESKGA